MTKSLKVFYQNTRGLRTKIARGLKDKITLNNFDIVCLTETWLCDRFDSESIFDVETYITHRSDRSERTYTRPNNTSRTNNDTLTGGGSLIAIKRNISAIRLKHWELETPFDNIWLKINTHNNKRIFVNCIYINHQTNFDRINTYFMHLHDIINLREPNSHFIILGDFNLPCIEWIYDSDKCTAISHEGRLANELLNTLHLTGLSQTNYIRNNYGRILDLALTNLPNTSVKRVPGIVEEDLYHPALLLNLESANIKFMKSKKTAKLNFFKANYESINVELNRINWNSELSHLPINDATNKFYNIINTIISQFTPKISPRSDDFPKWFSPKLIQLIRLKEHYFKLKKRTNNMLHNTLFNEKRKEVKHEKKKCLYEYQTNIESLIKSNPKSFFAYTKSLRKTNKLPAVMQYKNQTAENMKETATQFAKHFASVYEANNSPIILQCDNECHQYLQFTETEILNVINKLDKCKTNSPDGIPPIFYIETADSIAKALTILFNMSTSAMTYPDEFKKSIITPIYKSGDIENVENYRPISILPTISKIFDKLLYLHINSKTSHLISSCQHGFTAGKSTTTNLLEYVDYLSSNMMNGGQVDAIYMDLAKAFDKIDHNILIAKLGTLPLSPCLIILLQSYLTNRKQFVCVYGEKSDAITPESSVPQGSILSPLLFALFINDLPPRLKSKLLLFADDLKLFLKINSLEDALQLQKDIDTIYDWCLANNLRLNINKCYVMSYTRRREVNLQYFNYNINGSSLIKVNAIRDLGVIFDSKLTFERHFQNIVNSACKVLGFISRSLNKFKKIETYITLYNSYVRSILEYASAIWNPHYQNHTASIERVQKKFTRTLFRKFNYPYENYNTRLIRLNFISLENRRALNDEILLYKIKNGILKVSIDRNYEPIQTRITRFNRAFYLPFVTTNVEFNCPFLRMHRRHMELFNELDLHEPTLQTFKRYALYETKQLNPPQAY